MNSARACRRDAGSTPPPRSVRLSADQRTHSSKHRGHLICRPGRDTAWRGRLRRMNAAGATIHSLRPPRSPRSSTRPRVWLAGSGGASAGLGVVPGYIEEPDFPARPFALAGRPRRLRSRGPVRRMLLLFASAISVKCPDYLRGDLVQPQSMSGLGRGAWCPGRATWEAST
jgi:hypothetical protein